MDSSVESVSIQQELSLANEQNPVAQRFHIQHIVGGKQHRQASVPVLFQNEFPDFQLAYRV